MENKNLNQSDGVEVSIKPTTSSQEEDLDVATLASLSPGTHVITRTYSSQLVGNITVKLPSGVTLIFQGGKIEKGSATSLTIQGNDTAIQAPITQIFGEGVSASGTWLIDRAFPQWFDEKVGKESWLVNIAKNLIIVPML